MALFPRCNNPVPVVGRHGTTLVGCHSCIQCRVAAQEHLCKLLEVEASKHKYVELLNLTYDDLHLPYIDTSYMYPFGYALRIPNRVIKKYNRKTKSYYFVEDKISKSFQLTSFDTLDTASMLRDYFTRIDKYFSRFPSRSRGIRNNSVVPILWYDDIRKYIGRLRKWFKKEYNETIRYYIICEYGTQSFRPHYHILLFHDSPRARADFRNVRVLPQSTKDNPREVCFKLYLAELWVYGDTTQRLPMVICKNILVNILHNILTSLECLQSFHKGPFIQSYWDVRTKQRLKNYLPLEISRHLLLILSLTKKVSDALFPCRMRITVNLPLDLRVLPSLILAKLLPYFVRWYTLPDASLHLKEKSMMMVK